MYVSMVSRTVKNGAASGALEIASSSLEYPLPNPRIKKTVMKATRMVYDAILLAGCLRALSIAYWASAREGIEEERARVAIPQGVKMYFRDTKSRSTKIMMKKLTTKLPPKMIEWYFHALSAVILIFSKAIAHGRTQSKFEPKLW
ncbi:17212_t:CDS:2 [Acaulospora colombiana]|uniref:17212_t:CDS:1 n=1 Tax=Acaulospora colombiana TaxID=27376 RepID=A0ACA9PHY5_9GLOM|nr:17212_t:CDS:2 [Acaulospora colombiana]